MKYIRLNKYRGAYNVCFTFDDLINHDDMLRTLGANKSDLVSAGFIHLSHSEMGNAVFKPFGKSVTLGVTHHEDDYMYLNRSIFDTLDTESY